MSPKTATVEQVSGETWGRTRSMASEIAIRVRPRDDLDAGRAVTKAISIFERVESSCTRFDPNSSLMLANEHRNNWHQVDQCCFAAILEAANAYVETGGRFDPRVLEDLVALGYDRSFNLMPQRTPSGIHSQSNGRRRPPSRRPRPTWQPGFRHDDRLVLLGDHAVDLGGIGKGLAVRWASDQLSVVSDNFLVDAGGDCYCAGTAPDGQSWKIGIEDPRGDPHPLVVLAVTDRAVTTSSIRLRRWRRGDEEIHHLVDPRSGKPGGMGLAAVTVVGEDPAISEVWSKALFLEGTAGIGDLARRKALAALWIAQDGSVAMSAPMERFVCWSRS